jgi:hypothetical protein
MLSYVVKPLKLVFGCDLAFAQSRDLSLTSLSSSASIRLK